MKGLAILLALISLTAEASAQRRVHYGADGKVVARSTTGTARNRHLWRDAARSSAARRSSATRSRLRRESGRIVGRVTGGKR